MDGGDTRKTGYKFSEGILSKRGSLTLLLPNLGFSEPSEKEILSGGSVIVRSIASLNG